MNEKEIYVDLIYGNIKPIYQVSNLGNIKNKVTGKILKPKIYNAGYYRINLATNDKKGDNQFSVHRLVATMFIPKTEEDIKLGRNVVNHKDTDKLNNTWTNLEWMTVQENTLHGIKNDCLRYPLIMNKKKQINRRTVSNKDIHLICKLICENKSNKEIYNELGWEGTSSDMKYISKIRNGRRHNDILSQYKLPEPRSIKYKLPINSIIYICNCIQSTNMSNTEICISAGLEYNFNNTCIISNIRCGKTYKDISSHYPFYYKQTKIRELRNPLIMV